MSLADSRDRSVPLSKSGLAFAHAAAVLRRTVALDEPSAATLRVFEYDLPDIDRPADDRDLHRARLLEAASHFVRFFQLNASDSPGLAVFGAEIDPTQFAPWWPGKAASVSGAALTRRQAFEACVGEAVEFLSGLVMSDESRPMTRRTLSAATVDAATEGLVTDLLALRGLPLSSELDWVVANRLSDGGEILLPADLCVRRDPARRVIEAAFPLSIGCAAAPDPGSAVLRGLLELIERDAAALWWRGGLRGRLLPFEHDAHRRAALTLQTIRQGRSRRRTWLLDITTDLGIPCVAAVSFAADGRGFCVGTAARLGLTAACEAALREMCQMELAHDIVQAKRAERGEGALNAVDLRHARRFTGIDQAGCALVHPLPPSPDLPPDLTGGGLRAIVERLAASGLRPSALDLTNSALGIAVARVVCPGLEQEPCEIAGERLREAIRVTGGGAGYSQGIPLM